MFNEFLVRPIFNLLIFFTSVIPGHSLALGIIVLTIVVRLILLVPQSKAIRSQAEMQKIQPILAKIKVQHKGNQQKISEETMKVFQQHKVNPFGGCLPLLIQLPIIYAVFAVMRLGINTSQTDFLYSFMSFPEIIDYSFFWIQNLEGKDLFVLPILVGVFQFIQMKIMMVKNKKKSADPLPTEQSMMQNMMTYFMPVFIAFIARGFSAALSLYWVTSTVFAILQQEFVLRMLKGEKEVLVVSDLSDSK